MSTLDRLFRREHEFHVEGLGTVRIRNLSEADRSEIFDGIVDDKGTVTDGDLCNRRMFAKAVVAIDGEPVSLTADQVREMDMIYWTRIWKQVYDHCHLGDTDSGNSNTEPST